MPPASPSSLSILHTESSPHWGGQEIRTLTESRGMLDRGHRVKIIAPADARILPAAARLGIPHEAVDIGRKRIANLARVRAWLRRHARDFDVVNTHSSTDSWLVALASATSRGALPIVRTRHVSTDVGSDPFTRWLYLRAASHIVTTGEALRAKLARENGVPLERMTSVRTGIDLDRYRPLDRKVTRAKLGLGEAPTLGIVATLRPWKGTHYLIEAMAKLHARFPRWRLVVIGEGYTRPEYEAQAARLGLAQAVRFLGNRDDVPECLGAMDLFALPSYGEEGVPQAIMQAMATGLAVVSTPVGAIAEAVRDRETGLLVPPRDSGALAEALASLMGDDARREAMGRAGLAYARAHFGIAGMLDRMEAVFRRVTRPPAQSS
jgi:glycosyltransferase involved in cell wall biosynthesis